MTSSIIVKEEGLLDIFEGNEEIEQMDASDCDGKATIMKE
jgi:hypothetical protein